MIEDSYFCSSVPAEAVIIAILKYASFYGYAALKTEKLNLLNSVSVGTMCAVSKVTKSFRNAVFRP